jgi:hypothetical protein
LKFSLILFQFQLGCNEEFCGNDFKNSICPLEVAVCQSFRNTTVVTAIRCRNCFLNGTLLSNLNELSHLKSIDLKRNNIYGSLNEIEFPSSLTYM